MLRNFFFIFITMTLSVVSCTNRKEKESSGAEFLNESKDITNLNFTTEEAPEWTDMFYRDSGWFGADGIFSIPLNRSGEEGDSILFIFSDTMIGEPGKHKILREHLVNNTVAYLKNADPNKEEIKFFYDEQDDGTLKALFVPNTTNAGEQDYYWLGDGFVNHSLNSDIYIFAYRMRNMDESDWSFTQVGNALIVIPENSRPPFRDHKQIETPFLIKGENESENASLGAGVFDNTKEAGAPNPDGHIYVYGKKGRDQGVIVARVLPVNFEKFDTWRFWNGEEWSPSMEEAVVVATRVSNELSVSPLDDGRYALVFQVGGMGRKVGLCLGETPHGPFGPIIDLFEATEGERKNYYTYNAKAHPSLSKSGELIISYNVNAFDYWKEINENPYLYRPRFIRVKIDE